MSPPDREQTFSEMVLEVHLVNRGYRIVRGSLRFTGPRRCSWTHDGEIRCVTITGTVGV